MYVTTFYSFKGGVGRSMALANVAVELAKRGRHVLVVDFDLEAPGLDTFDVLRPPGEVPGIIDFVHDYLDTDRAPDAREFMSRLPAVGEDDGELWIMPSGAQRATYAAHFNDIDWMELYEKRDGYLLFEDLKAQWQQTINPDYVLIDSRTGHTDTGGICTRQLPDAVVILFFPNEQNLRGLTKVVRDIRAEAEEPRRKEIELHFVMSNVPDLDDEDRILQKKIDAFRKDLGFEGEPAVVHRYDSLSLLNQMVFTKERPRSRLAREYCGVVQEIVRRNLADRDGALDYVRQAGTGERRVSDAVTYVSAAEIDRKLAAIAKAHAGDGGVVFALGTLAETRGQPERAASLFQRAIEVGYDDPEAHLRLAHSRTDGGDSARASEDALRVLMAENVSYALVLDAAGLVSADRAADVAASAAVVSMDVGGRLRLADELDGSRDQIAIAIRLLKPIVEDDSVPPSERRSARIGLASRYLGIGRCDAAAALLRHGDRDVGAMDVEEAFNYGMALWGGASRVVPGPFARFLELDEERDPDPYPGRRQRMALAYWATGEPALADDYIELAREAVEADHLWPGPHFSCWRYHQASAEDFLKDLDEIEALIGGDTSKKPRFMNAEEQALNSPH